MTRIYALIDPRTDRVHYVGKTDKKLGSRSGTSPSIQAGLSKAKREWLADLRENELRPKVEVLEVVDGFYGAAREQWWIAELLSRGEPLTNTKHTQPNMVLVCVTLPQELADKARALGGGNVSQGIRKALEATG